MRTLGIAKVGAGGTINRGDRVGTDGNGKAVAKAADGDIILGTAIEGAVAGQFVRILMPAVSQRAS